MLKQIDLTNKCGSCDHFKQIENTATGECLQNPYNDTVVHDPKHPHWIVQRSRIKCPLYNTKPQTNADRIRSMSDEELADLISDPVTYSFNCGMCPANPQFGSCVHKCKPHILAWLKSEVKE